MIPHARGRLALLTILPATLLAAAGSAMAAPARVVHVHLVAHARDVARVEATVTRPIERAVQALPRARSVHTQTRDGIEQVLVDLEIGFDGGASEQDLALVRRTVAAVDTGIGVDRAAVSVVSVVPAEPDESNEPDERDDPDKPERPRRSDGP